MLQKTNVSGYYKDSESKVVINTNYTEYKRILAARKKAKEEKALHQEINSMRNEMEELKNMVRKVLHG